jgi:hypothetical protein
LLAWFGGDGERLAVVEALEVEVEMIKVVKAAVTTEAITLA